MSYRSSRRPSIGQSLLRYGLMASMVVVLGVGLSFGLIKMTKSAVSDELAQVQLRLSKLRSHFDALHGGAMATPNKTYTSGGWMAEVFLPPQFGQRISGNNVGVFRTHTSNFMLRMHELHGVAQRRPLAYRMYSLLKVSRAGVHQFAIEANLDRAMTTTLPRCRIDLNIGYDFSQRFTLNFLNSQQDVMAGISQLSLPEGIHPVSIDAYCDEQSAPAVSSALLFQVKIREPGDGTFKTNPQFFVPTAGILGGDARPSEDETPPLEGDCGSFANGCERDSGYLQKVRSI